MKWLALYVATLAAGTLSGLSAQHGNLTLAGYFAALSLYLSGAALQERAKAS